MVSATGKNRQGRKRRGKRDLREFGARTKGGGVCKGGGLSKREKRSQKRRRDDGWREEELERSSKEASDQEEGPKQYSQRR